MRYSLIGPKVAWWFLARPLRTLVATALVLLLAVPEASADPLADKRAEAGRLSQQLDEQGERISLLAEQVNNARLKADEVEAAAAAVAAELARVERAVADAVDRLREQAVNAYVRGGRLPAVQMLMSGHTDDLAVRNTYVETVVGQEQAALDVLHAAQVERKAKQASMEASRAAARAALAAVEQSRREAAAAEAAQRATLSRVEGELGALVEADRRRREEEAARRAQAELARRQAEEDARRRSRPPSSSSGPAPPTGPARPPAAGAAAAVEEARRQLGKPYEWGADGPDSFDCSGLTKWAWKAGGKSLPHSSQAQYNSTSRVALAQVQPGDLLFYGNPIHHVGIAVGDGRMIEASQTGTPVRYASIYRSDLAGVGRVG